MFQEKEIRIPSEEVKLVKSIGSGRFGKVYLADYHLTDVAVKELELNTQELIGSRIAREVIYMKNLRHPNLIYYYGHFIKDRKVSVVMELCKGGSLFSLLHERNISLSIQQKLKILFDSAAGLVYLHSQLPPISHRDIKSPNILIVEQVKDDNSTVTAKITDYGLSRMIYENSKSTVAMTSECGTVAWMAPEVLKGEKYGVKCDVYSFAILMWEIFSQNIPYFDMNLGSQMVLGIKVAHEKLRPSLNLLPADTPKEIIELVVQCWSEKESKRPSMKEIAGILKTLVKQ